MNPSIRLQIATRIHFGLLRHFDENVEVATLLNGEGEAHEALWVCEASGNRELAALARAFRNADAPAAKDAAAPRDSGWGREPSGFGSTGFANTGFGTTGVGELTELAEPTRNAPRASWFGKLSAVLPR